MKKYLISLVVLGVALFGSQIALADDSPFEQQLSKSACDSASGKPVVKVEQKIKNDADSGVAGNTWAFDNYKRQITVYKTAIEGKFCAIVKYEGKFKTVAGASPQNSGTVGNGIKGKMEGGYRATFSGSLKESPTWKLFGNVGKFDYQCDLNFNCPGRVSWLGVYFNGGDDFDQPWWGWKYTTEDNGTWYNQVSGNVGDITGIATEHDEE